MSTQNEKSQKLYASLWECANVLRGSMDASEYKDYLLGLIFYRFLSEKLLKEFTKLSEDDASKYAHYLDPNFKIDGKSVRNYVIYNLQNSLGYFIEPKYLFSSLINEIKQHKFQLDHLAQALHNVVMSTSGHRSEHAFQGLFDDVDLNSKHLGSTFQKRNDAISNVMLNLNNIDLNNYQGDVLGDAYEYLISEFANESGKKAGAFYTPRFVSDVLAQIVTYHHNKGDNQIKSIYDPCMGSGSLLLTVGNHVEDPSAISYHGQELNSTTYNLARMNLMLHGVSYEDMYLRNGDTLSTDWPPSSQPYQFDAVVMNPPYSWKWGGKNGADDYNKKLLSDPRFRDYGVLPPKSKADYAFLLHGFYHLKSTGTMAIVLPHGVLFRGSKEATIRKKLLLDNHIDAIIGMPAKMFHSTGIPTIVMVLKKNKRTDNVLFIDASKEYKKQGKQNVLTKDNINKIVNTYKNRKDVKRFAHVASMDEIKKNDYNLNIPRYVDTFVPEPDISISDTKQKIADVDAKIKQTKAKFEQMEKQLVWTNKGDSHNEK